MFTGQKYCKHLVNSKGERRLRIPIRQAQDEAVGRMLAMVAPGPPAGLHEEEAQLYHDARHRLQTTLTNDEADVYLDLCNYETISLLHYHGFILPLPVALGDAGPNLMEECRRQRVDTAWQLADTGFGWWLHSFVMAAGPAIAVTIALWAAFILHHSTPAPEPPTCVTAYVSLTMYYCLSAAATAMTQAILLFVAVLRLRDKAAIQVAILNADQPAGASEEEQAHLQRKIDAILFESGCWGGWFIPYVISAGTSLAAAVVLAIAWHNEVSVVHHNHAAPPAASPPPPGPPLQACPTPLAWTAPFYAGAATITLVLLAIGTGWLQYQKRQVALGNIAEKGDALRKKLDGKATLAGVINVAELMKPYIEATAAAAAANASAPGSRGLNAGDLEAPPVVDAVAVGDQQQDARRRTGGGVGGSGDHDAA